MNSATDHLKVSSLFGLSYSVQRQSTEHQGTSISVLISAGSAEVLNIVEGDREDWGVLVTHGIETEHVKNIIEAVEICSVDNVNRRFITTAGDELFTERMSVEENRKSLRSRLPILAQIVDLQQKFINESSLTQEYAHHLMSEKTTGSNDAVAEDGHLETETRPFQADMISNTVDINPDDFSDKVKVTHTKGHLLIIASGAFESITPNLVPKDLKSFESITIYFCASHTLQLSWQRWASQVGATLFCAKDYQPHLLAARLQWVSRSAPRRAIHLSTADGFSISSVTHISPTPSPVPVEYRGRERAARSVTLWTNITNGQDRWVTVVSLRRISSNTTQPTLSVDPGGQRLMTLYIDELSVPIILSQPPMPTTENKKAEARTTSGAFSDPLNGKRLPRRDSHMIGVAFSLQLTHRVRLLDNLMLTMLREETRKSAKLLDQLIKITTNLEGLEKVEGLKSLKVKLLATGLLERSDQEYIAAMMTRSTHRLSLNGSWHSVP